MHSDPAPSAFPPHPGRVVTDAAVERRLAAIMATDVVGYSRLMGADEAGTLSTLRRRHRAIVVPVVEAFRGRIVKLMGDGLLVEFASAVDAVECALSMQRTFATANTEQTGAGMRLRIGINLGDIIVEGSDIFGEGVNVAARLETAAPEGGILLSDSIHAQARGKVSESFEDAGEMRLRNIADPVRTWRWAGAGTASPIADVAPGHSIAVLPFSNMSDTPGQDYFSDGISEDIITDLSKIPGLMVVARNSSFAYKGQSPDIRTVGRELGVAVVLEGSVRRSGTRVRVNAQLIDAATGGHLWAERYDRDLTDIFEVQDEVTAQIVSVLKGKLLSGGAVAKGPQKTQSVEAYDLTLRGRAMLLTLPHGAGDKTALLAEGIALLERAVALDPSYALPHAVLSILHMLDYQNAWSKGADPLARALSEAETAVAIDPGEPFGHFAKSVACTFVKDLVAARVAAEAALALNPNFAAAYGTMGNIETYRGNPGGALPYLEVALRLDPGFRSQTLHFFGLARLMAGDLEGAQATLRERLALTPGSDISRAYLAVTLGLAGAEEAARAVWAELMAINPDYSFDAHMHRLPWQRPDQIAYLRGGLEMAGIRP